jgi:hypothetical protein
MVSKSATADFDARVSKDGHGDMVPASILRDAVLRTAPDEVGGLKFRLVRSDLFDGIDLLN